MISISQALNYPWWMLVLVSIGVLGVLLCLCVVIKKLVQCIKRSCLARRQSKKLSKYGADSIDTEDPENHPFKPTPALYASKSTSPRDIKINYNITAADVSHAKQGKYFDNFGNSTPYNDDFITYTGFESNTNDLYDSEEHRQSINNLKNSHKKLKKHKRNVSKYRGNHTKSSSSKLNISMDDIEIERAFDTDDDRDRNCDGDRGHSGKFRIIVSNFDAENYVSTDYNDADNDDDDDDGDDDDQVPTPTTDPLETEKIQGTPLALAMTDASDASDDVLNECISIISNGIASGTRTQYIYYWF